MVSNVMVWAMPNSLLSETDTGFMMCAKVIETNLHKKSKRFEKPPFACIFTAMSQTIYDYSIHTLSRQPFDFSALRGKKILVVNTASKCGLTPQYEGLQALYDQYQAQGFVVVGFPANNFMSQEPGTSAEIATFCQKKHTLFIPINEIYLPIMITFDDQYNFGYEQN
jgi:glutathione peroxidase